MTLSVVIPSHRRVDLLRACLASVVRHAPPGTQIVVVDDGSASACVSETAKAFPVVEIVRLARPRGFCTAVNVGIAAGTRPIVELLNDDAEVTAGWADAAVEHFRDPSVGAVAPLVLGWPGGPRPWIDSAGDCYHAGGVAAKRGHRQALGPAFLRPCRVFGASGSSAFYRREALLRVGAFPPSFGAYFEDVDLAFRLHRAAYHVVYEPNSRVLHHVSASHGRRPSHRLLARQSLNEERVFWRNLPARCLVQFLPAHLAVLLGKAWRRWQEGQLIPFLCGRFRAVADLPGLLRHRQRLGKLGPRGDLKSWLVDCRYASDALSRAAADTPLEVPPD